MFFIIPLTIEWLREQVWSWAVSLAEMLNLGFSFLTCKMKRTNYSIMKNTVMYSSS